MESLVDLRDRLCREHHLESLWVSWVRGTLHIDLIMVDPAYQGEGHGGRAMAALCAWADHECEVLTLTASDEYGSDRDRLETWYTRLGFESGYGPRGARMIREPRGFAVPQNTTEEMS